MKSLVVVSTSPRPNGTDYVRATVSAFEEWGGARSADVRMVISDGRTSVQLPWDIKTYEQRGSRFNFMRAVEFAAEIEATHFIYVEDDTVPCIGAVPRMLATASVPGSAFTSYFDAGGLGQNWPDGIYLAPLSGPMGHGLRCSQALAFTGPTLEWLIHVVRVHGAEAAADGGAFTAAQRELFEGKGNSVDKAVSALVENGAHFDPYIPFRYALHLPCLIEHVGAQSVAHPGLSIDRPRGVWQRCATRFPGKDFDADRLSTPLVRRVERQLMHRLHSFQIVD